MIRKHKKFSRPRKAFDSQRIKEEDKITEKYGLKNKKEIWKAKAKLKIMRNQAKKLINSDEEKRAIFLKKLNNLGFNVKTPEEVLALTEEDILKRRLQTIVLKRGVATTAKGARQLITHKHIAISGKVVNIPSYLVNIEEEKKINSILKPKRIEDIGKKSKKADEEIKQKEQPKLETEQSAQ